ncbi:FxLD family lanthipeptide [Actinoallomurus sp. NPDC052274]|jgi:FxLD family lantipeptide|uniref:FxLD family lanthipeptide n=1 Tax=Actinoallomurus sp. NPDC052274 TaxID=3155420 RepID=UPI003416B638
MSPLALDTHAPGSAAPAADEEFMLDMRVVEQLTPIASMMCGTGDGCGSTCSTSACATGSNDPS